MDRWYAEASIPSKLIAVVLGSNVDEISAGVVALGMDLYLMVDVTFVAGTYHGLVLGDDGLPARVPSA